MSDSQILGARSPEELVSSNQWLDHLGSVVFPDMQSGADRLQRTWAALLDWEDDLVTVGVELAVGFAISGDASDTIALTDIQLKLGKIQDSLDSLNNKIDGVLAAINQLPGIIAGIVDSAFAKKAVLNSITAAGQLRDNTKDLATYNANKQSVHDELDALENAIDEIWGFCDNSVMAAVLAAGPTAMWAQGKSFQLRDPVVNPSHYTIKDQSIFKRSNNSYSQFMTTVTQVKGDTQNTFLSIPHETGPVVFPQCWEFDASTRKFLPLQFENFTRQQYRGTKYDPDKLFASCHFSINGNPVVPYYGLVDLNYAWIDPANVNVAKVVWPSFQVLMSQCRQTLRYLENSDGAFATIKQAFALP